MTPLLIAALLQAASAVPASGAPAPAVAAVPDDENTITVTGIRLEDLAAAVDRCRQTPCPPRRDIVASIRYAEALFRAGSYTVARRELKAAVGRVKGAAAAEPLAVSQLYYALATLTAHEGDQRDHAQATYASARVLHDARPATAPEVLVADLRVGDLGLRTGDFNTARATYASIARRAAASNQPVFAAAADLRRAMLLQRQRQRGAAAELLADIAARPGTGTGQPLAPMRHAALAQAARNARDEGDKAATDRFLAALLAEPPGPEPMLVFEPPAPTPTQTVATNNFETTIDRETRSSDLQGLRWVDIGFWIRSDGRVGSTEILRGSHNLRWAAPLVGMIGRRRYTPFADNAAALAAAGQYRIERYTWTADYAVPKGSLIRRRFANPRYERLELTASPPTSPSS